jgi:hypothetical protein
VKPNLAVFKHRTGYAALEMRSTAIAQQRLVLGVLGSLAPPRQ